MSKQIAVRLPNSIVDFLDELVSSGAASSRASVVTRALEREYRRRLAEHDVEILKSTGPDSEIDGLAEHLSGRDIGLGE